jgi:hypothetical protein
MGAWFYLNADLATEDKYCPEARSQLEWKILNQFIAKVQTLKLMIS